LSREKNVNTTWQKESWEHLVRRERQFAKFVRYIRNNDPAIAYCVYEMETGET